MRTLFHLLTRSVVSLAGTTITTASALVFATLFVIDLVRETEGPYAGILAYLIVPSVFIVGLLLIPAGILLERRRARKAGASGAPAAGGAQAALPVIDFNRSRTRVLFLTFAALTAANVIILSTATFKGVEVLESTRFCGTTCHTVMQPEYTSYRRSPHAHVKCVSCHVGPGGRAFVRAKLNGTSQVLAVTFDRYPRPIPVPVQTLRAAGETCGQCHSPERYSADRLKVISHRNDDETSSALKTVLMMRVGGRRGGVFEGIHWHANPGVRIRYRSDESRGAISDVELTLPDGSVRVYTIPNAAPATTAGSSTDSWRTMDCIDCHNRPAHVSRTPESEVDQAIDQGRIDGNLPFVRREAVRALRGTYSDAGEARRKMTVALLDFYRAGHPEIAETKRERIEKAGGVLGDIYGLNVFPAMKVSWGTYPDHLGHNDSPGCFRCHDELHAAPDGKTISQDCGLCHAIPSMGEAQPKILDEIYQ